jgi:hypothetical protein
MGARSSRGNQWILTPNLSDSLTWPMTFAQTSLTSSCHTLRLYLLNLNRRLRLRPLHRISSHRATTDLHGPSPRFGRSSFRRRFGDQRNFVLSGYGPSANLITVREGLRVRGCRLLCHKWIPQDVTRGRWVRLRRPSATSSAMAPTNNTPSVRVCCLSRCYAGTLGHLLTCTITVLTIKP